MLAPHLTPNEVFSNSKDEAPTYPTDKLRAQFDLLAQQKATVKARLQQVRGAQPEVARVLEEMLLLLDYTRQYTERLVMESRRSKP